MERSEKIIAVCGLMCDECPAYIATQADDYEGRARTAAKWSEQLGLDIKPDDVICDGCQPRPGGRLGGYCSECPFRACALGKSHPNCGHCDDYPCADLAKFQAHSTSGALATLEAIHRARRERE